MAEKQLIDGAWYWVRFETGFKDEWTQAPAMYKSGADAWYSFLFAGIPARRVEVLGKIDAPAPAEPAASATQAGAANPAAPVVLPEPDFYVRPGATIHPNRGWQCWNNDGTATGAYHALSVHTLLASLAPPAPAAVAEPASEIATAVCQRVAELDDRSSPEGQPEMMLVTADELHGIVCAALAATPAAKAEVQPTSFQVQAITTAYEQGVGKGNGAHQRGFEVNNPYSNGYRCDEAWNLGYQEGKRQAAAKAEVQAEPVADDTGTLRAEANAHAAKGSRLVRTLFNESTGTLSDTEVGTWIQLAQQYLFAISLTAPQATQPGADAMDDTKLLNFLRDECCDLRCDSSPTGGDDSEVYWKVIEHHMAKPHEREIGRSYRDEPRQAIRAAMAADQEGGAA